MPNNHFEIQLSLIIQESDISTKSQHIPKFSNTTLLLNCGRKKVLHMQVSSFVLFFFPVES